MQIFLQPFTLIAFSRVRPLKYIDDDVSCWLQSFCFGILPVMLQKLFFYLSNPLDTCKNMFAVRHDMYMPVLPIAHLSALIIISLIKIFEWCLTLSRWRHCVCLTIWLIDPSTEVRSNLYFGARNSGYIAFDQHSFTIAFGNNLIQI